MLYCAQYSLSYSSGPGSDLQVVDGLSTQRDFVLEELRGVRSVRLFRAAYLQTVDQGNRGWRLTFDRVREHATHAAALEFIGDHALQCAGFTDADAVLTANGEIFTLSDANFDGAPAGQIYKSCFTRFKYVLVGGALAKTP